MFKFDWWERNVPAFEWLTEVTKISEKTPVSLLEVGSFEGRSALWFANNWLGHPESSLVCIDSWGGGREHQDLNMQEIEATWDRVHGNNSKVKKLKADSKLALASLWLQGYRADFAYVDAGHESHQVLSDLVLVYELVKPGGIIVCDDNVWGGHLEDPRLHPRLAHDCFYHSYSRFLKPIGALPAFIVGWQKTDERD